MDLGFPGLRPPRLDCAVGPSLEVGLLLLASLSLSSSWLASALWSGLAGGFGILLARGGGCRRGESLIASSLFGSISLALEATGELIVSFFSR